MIVYAIFFNMEDEVPDAYVLEEDLAKDLIAGNEYADYVVLRDISMKQWMSMLTGEKQGTSAKENPLDLDPGLNQALQDLQHEMGFRTLKSEDIR